MKIQKINAIIALLLVIGPMLGCAPMFWEEDDSGNPKPVEIRADWQCSTPSPIPTITINKGFYPTPIQPTVLEGEPTVEWNPTAEPKIEFSTPEPTATFYVRGGSDYFQGQRIIVASGDKSIGLTVTGYATTPAGNGLDYHRVSIRIENNMGRTLGIFSDLAVLRTIKKSDNTTIVGEWCHDASAAKALGVVPSQDPTIEFSGDDVVGGYPEGVITRELIYKAPAGRAQLWGISLIDNDGTKRDGGFGSGQIWVTLKADPNCTNGGGGAISPPTIEPNGTPVAGPGRWPVPRDTGESRGYGCHSFFTGTRGNCPAGEWWHDGIDFAAPKGTPLFAIRSITIEFAGKDGSSIDCSSFAGSEAPHNGFGYYIRATDGDYVYWYGHLSSWSMGQGQRATEGQEIAKMGSTGCSTGSHLHFRVRRNGLDINPADVISK